MHVPLKDLVADIPSIRGVFITVMPDCLLYDSWVNADDSWTAEEAASYFGDLVRANREGLKALSAWSSEMQVTIEAADVLLLVREVRGDFVVTCVFDHRVSLGMARLHLKRLLVQLEEALPTIEVEERPRAVRIIEFLGRYAPDAHAVLKRVSLRSGITLDELRRPEELADARVELLEGSVKDILGLEALTL